MAHTHESRTITAMSCEPWRKLPRCWIWPALGAAVALSLIVSGCGNGSGGADGPEGGSPEPSPSPAATTTPDDAVPEPTPAPEDNGFRDALKLMVIQEEDLPTGLQLVSQGFTTNEEIVEASADPEAEQADLARLGRILSYTVTFQPGPDILPVTAIRGISATVSLYETAEGAADSFTQAAADATERDWKADNPGLTEFQVQPIELEAGADELLWLRLSGVSAEPQGIVVDDVILMRVGRARGFLRVLATAPDEGRNLLLDEVEDWLRTQIERVKETLAAGIEP